jgi:hypothetical protein
MKYYQIDNGVFANGRRFDPITHASDLKKAIILNHIVE